MAYAAGLMASVAAPIMGFMLDGIGRTLSARFVAWLPSVGVLAALVVPALYQSRII